MKGFIFWNTETTSTAISSQISFPMVRVPATLGNNNVRLWLLLLLSLSCQTLQAQTGSILTDSLPTHGLLQYRPGEEGYAPAGLYIKARQSPVFMGTALVVVGSGVWTATFALADEPLQMRSRYGQREVKYCLSREQARRTYGFRWWCWACAGETDFLIYQLPRR